MGKDCNPGINLQHPSWKYDNLSCTSNHQPPDVGQQTTNLMAFPIYSNPFGCALTGSGSMPFPGFTAPKFYQMNAATIAHLNAINAQLGLSTAQKGFLVFDHSGVQTNLIFSSVSPRFPKPNLGSLGVDPLRSAETNVSYGHGISEMCEDTEEIDALLYSDSYEVHSDEEDSTGHSPLDATGSTEEVASSPVPAKRRRLDKELDASLADSASSAVHYSESHPHHNLGNGYEPRFMEGSEERVSREEQDTPSTDAILWNKRAKRERIRKTVSVLRRIIPSSKGKDAAAVLEEAICYLRSLKLKAKALGATYL